MPLNFTNIEDAILKASSYIDLLRIIKKAGLPPQKFSSIFRHITGALPTLDGSSLPPQAIISAWKADPSINLGRPDMIVTHPDPENPLDETKPSALINLTTCNIKQFNEKLQFARSVAKKQPFVMIANLGSSYALLIIDDETKKIRFIDSSGKALPEKFRALISQNETLRSYRYVNKPVERQQHNKNSGVFWLLQNARAIAKHGIEATLITPKSIAEETKIINQQKLKIYKYIFRQITTHLREEELSPALSTAIAQTVITDTTKIQNAVATLRKALGTPRQRNPIARHARVSKRLGRESS
jgi:hypothetical protein